MTLLEALRALRDDGPRLLTEGICCNLQMLPALEVGYVSKMHRLFKTWPAFSGDLMFPVPGSPVSDPRRMYKLARWVTDVSVGTGHWDKSTDYGALRWELLDFMISELEKELEQ